METAPPPAASPGKTSRWRHLRFHTSKATPSTHPTRSAASPETPHEPHSAVLKEGFLLKKGHRVPTTKERYFVLRPQLLSYFKPRHTQHAAAPSTDARHLKGVIALSLSDLITPIATTRHWLLLQQLSGRDGKPYKLELRAASPEERQQWIDALRAAARNTPATAAQTARQAERERQLTRTLTMLRVRDATLLSTVLRQQTQSTATGNALVAAPSVGDLRASFQIFHELVLLQSLVAQIKASWGPPAAWSCEQYDSLVHSIALAQQQQQQQQQQQADLSADSGTETSVLGVARALQYAFEEVPENQQKLLARQSEMAAEDARATSAITGRLRCPTIYSYLSTFERFSPGDSTQRRSEDSGRSSSASSSGTASARSSWTSTPTADGLVLPAGPLSPRSATLSKYAHLYLEEEGRHGSPWSWDRAAGDDLVDLLDASAVTQTLADRFARDRVYAYVRHHSLLFVNPNRVLTTSKFTSIYDEQVVLVYAQTPFAQTQLAPHPFAMAKQALFRLFLSHEPRQSMVLSGDSGSGKTELSKELLKYVVLTAQPTAAAGRKVVLYTSSTKSTFQMRNEETRTLDLLHAKGVDDYEVVLLDLTPDKWGAMTRVSQSRRLPQVHVDGRFFGFYETLQRLEDEEQLRMYFRNAPVAHKLSSVLDSNILLEAFGHAATPLNANSSRYAKRVEIHVAFGREPSQYQVLGCALHPFLLEKARVTSSSNHAWPPQRNFHVLYALVHGVHGVHGAATPAQHARARRLHLEGCTSESFRYLGAAPSATSQHTSEAEWRRKKDAERFHHIAAAMAMVAIDDSQRDAIFRVLSAVLWLGNEDFAARDDGDGDADFVGASASPAATPIADVLVELLALDGVASLKTLLLQRRVDMASTGETFRVQLTVHQARHVRDTFARLLYETAFQFVVAQLNRATQCAADDRPRVRSLCIVDMFGFEDFAGGRANSLEQLCINYLTEKLAAVEQQLVAAQYSAAVVSSSRADDDKAAVLHLFEHPLGIFATLEEQTVLHQSEGDAADADREQKKNDLFVRYLYQRNQAQLAPQPSQLKHQKLLFLVPHARGVVTYDAQDFVTKNSDFQQHALLASLLEKTRDGHLQEMVRAVKQQQASTRHNGDKRGSVASGSGSLAAQFRSQIQLQLGFLREPIFLHCFRPNASTAWSSASHVDAEVLQRQVEAHGLAPMIELSRDASAAFEVAVDRELFWSRYKCLSLASSDAAVETLCESLEARLRGALNLADAESGVPLVVADSTTVVRVRSLQTAETLELLLAKRQYEAATRLQAAARMTRSWKWYHALQANRRALTQKLLGLYGPNSTRKIERTLRKYQGRESELTAKIAAKQTEKAAIAELVAGMETFMVQTGSSSGLDPRLLDEVLRDAEIQRLIAASNGRIASALREMSLNPQQVLPRQLADAELRAFYQRMLGLLQVALAQKQQVLAATEDAQDEEDAENRTLADRVRALVARHKTRWHELAHAPGEAWSESVDRLDEIEDEPEMLLFYADDDDFAAVFSAFVDTVEKEVKPGDRRSTRSVGASSAEAQTAELVAKLKRVEFSATLMAAMQCDPFFVEALRSPQVVTAVHQLMSDGAAFAAAHGGLRAPLLAEFFHRLVRLSDETRKHS